MSVRYEDAGVHLATSEQVTSRITDRLKNGLFGGFFPASALKAYDAPVLVSSIDGIGTKVRLASRLGNVDGLGLDLVHHCVNDIAVHGAIPLFFLDYLAFHTLDPALVHSLVDSMAGACAALDIQLAGGETAEMPLVYPPGQFDVAGAIVGVVEQQEIVDGSAIQAGDVLIGLPSSGAHTASPYCRSCSTTTTTVGMSRGWMAPWERPCSSHTGAILARFAPYWPQERCMAWHISPAAASPATSRGLSRPVCKR